MVNAPVKPDFGQSGHLTIRVSENGAHVAVSAGELIRCSLTVTGPGQAVFAFSCQHRPIRSAPDFPGHPKKTYEWTRFDHPGDEDAPADVHALVVAFAGGATSYTFLMEKISDFADVGEQERADQGEGRARHNRLHDRHVEAGRLAPVGRPPIAAPCPWLCTLRLQPTRRGM